MKKEYEIQLKRPRDERGRFEPTPKAEEKGGQLFCNCKNAKPYSSCGEHRCLQCGALWYH